eukprot:PhM_4_TR3801/c0_g1_i1/m.40200/K17800/LETM1, MDM38; LETM1 and EF-hand domain-containing protein 1, mitochondrial
MKDPNQTWMEWLRAGARFYWDGTKAYAWNTKHAAVLVAKQSAGHSLTRSQRMHLLVARKDCLKIVPFSVFVLVPFMEFLLPIALIYFPTLLPSTYEDEEHRAKRLAAVCKKRVTIAKELSVLEPKMTQILASKKTNVKDPNALKEPYFKNLTTRQLYLLNSYTGRTTPLADCTPVSLLRFNLRKRIQFLYRDDCLLRTWGVDRLNPVEVRDACIDRSLPYDLNLLSEWIEKSSSDPTQATTSWLLLEAVQNVIEGKYVLHEKE